MDSLQFVPNELNGVSITGVTCSLDYMHPSLAFEECKSCHLNRDKSSYRQAAVDHFLYFVKDKYESYTSFCPGGLYQDVEILNKIYKKTGSLPRIINFIVPDYGNLQFIDFLMNKKPFESDEQKVLIERIAYWYAHFFFFLQDRGVIPIINLYPDPDLLCKSDITTDIMIAIDVFDEAKNSPWYLYPTTFALCKETTLICFLNANFFDKFGDVETTIGLLHNNLRQRIIELGHSEKKWKSLQETILQNLSSPDLFKFDSGEDLIWSWYWRSYILKYW